MLSEKLVKDVIRLAEKAPINAYTVEGAHNKERFLKGCREIAKELARLMGLAKGSYDIRTNPGGMAVSGDVHLHGERIYVALEQSCIRGLGFYYRRCEGRKDYCGKVNRWVRWERLLDLPKLAAEMKKEIELTPPGQVLAGQDTERG